MTLKFADYFSVKSAYMTEIGITNLPAATKPHHYLTTVLILPLHYALYLCTSSHRLSANQVSFYVCHVLHQTLRRRDKGRRVQ